MVWLLRKCKECGKYTLKKEKCNLCGGKLRVPHPPKFSPNDKYVLYRVALNKETPHCEGDLHQRT